jgi:hypothetical protein
MFIYIYKLINFYFYLDYNFIASNILSAENGNNNCFLYICLYCIYL